MEVVSLGLRDFWATVLADKGWTAKELSRRSGVSYNYCRKITNGTVLPSRDALMRMCEAAGQEFTHAWAQVMSEPLPAKDVTADTIFPPAEAKMAKDLMLKMLTTIFEGLPLTAQSRLINQALDLHNEWNLRGVSAPGVMGEEPARSLAKLLVGSSDETS